MVTVSDVLARGGVDRVVCPAPDATVRWVAVNEMTDPAPFLEGGELLLFTGLETVGWREQQWNDYVGIIRRSGVAALGIAVGLTHIDVPTPLVAACTAHDVNLLSVPMRTSFVSVSQTVASLLEGAERQEARGAVAMQRRLARAARRAEAAGGITRELAAYLDGSVWVTRPDGSPVVSAGDAHRDADIVGSVAEEVLRIGPQGLVGFSTSSTPLGELVVHPIGLSEPPAAYLAVLTAVRPSDFHRTAVVASLSLLSLEIERRAERAETSRALLRRAVDLLVEGEVRAAERIASISLEQPWHLPSTTRVLVGAGDDDTVRRALLRLEDLPIDPTVLFAGGADLVVIAPSTAAGTWAAHLEDAGLAVGIGTAVGQDVGRSFRSAAMASERTTVQQRVVRWDELSQSGLLALVPATVREAFAEEMLGRLASAPSGARELRHVATSYLRHHGRTHAVAADLRIHRNTVRNRVREIENALGIDLDDPGDRLDLWAALQIERGADA